MGPKPRLVYAAFTDNRISSNSQSLTVWSSGISRPSKRAKFIVSAMKRASINNKYVHVYPLPLMLFALTAKEVSHLTGKITRGLSQINANS
jgi:hypothetical protein